MVNSQMIKEVVDAFKLDMNVDKIPQIIPVCEVNPKIVKRGFSEQKTMTSGTSSALYVAPLTQRTYITGAVLAWCRDATATSLSVGIYYTDVNNVLKYILLAPQFTLTASRGELVTPEILVEVLSGSTIYIGSSTNVANFSISGHIYGYTDEVS